MKKLLAIFLAVMMVFSLGVVGFAADDEEIPQIQLPVFPTPLEGGIFIACDNTYVEPGNTYEVPIYLVSDYTPSAEGTAVIGFKADLAGAPAYTEPPQMKLTAITPSAEVEALAGYELIGCGLNVGESGYNQFSFATTDLSIFQQEKFKLATVTIEVSADYQPKDKDGAPVDCILDLLPAEHFWYLFDAEYTDAALEYGSFVTSPMAIYDRENACEVESIVADGLNGPIYVSSGHVIEKPYEPTWGERLKEWALNVLSTILDRLADFFATLNNVLPDIV